MNNNKREIVFGAVLVLLSCIFYGIHFILFRDAHHIFIYLVGDIAFVFFEVLLVTMIIHRLLEQRDRDVLIRKQNMLIGVFFSETGSQLLRRLAAIDPEIQAKQKLLAGSRNDRPGEAFLQIKSALQGFSHRIDLVNVDWTVLKDFLAEKRRFMLGLMGNGSLLEHAAFTDLLWACFHLEEELSVRDISGPPSAADAKHLCGDVNRVYGLLARQWLAYMEHQQIAYPFLFSLAVRDNPFNRTANPVFS